MNNRGVLWTIVLCALSVGNSELPAGERGKPWNRHTIDNSSRGADGIRLADVNADGLMDIATGWEEGGKIRVYLNPGPKKSKRLHRLQDNTHQERTSVFRSAYWLKKVGKRRAGGRVTG